MHERESVQAISRDTEAYVSIRKPPRSRKPAGDTAKTKKRAPGARKLRAGAPSPETNSLEQPIMAKTDLKTEGETTTPIALTPEQAQATIPAGLASALANVTPADVASLAAQIAGLGTETQAAQALQPVTAAEARVTDEFADAGPAFGTFLKSIGTAVADTQKALDMSMVQTAEALSKQSVKIAAVFEQVVDDTGQLGASQVHMQDVPLITLVTPNALQFTQVHITADMEVEEFTNAKGLKIKKNHTDFNLNAKAKYSMFGGFGASGGTNLNVTSDGHEENTSDASDKAAGKLHMEATIEPREIPIPQPFVVQKGPRLRLVPGSRKDLKADGVTETTVPAEIKSREVVITAQLVKADGAPLAGKLQVTCDGAFPFVVTTSHAQANTTAADTGELTIKVTRGGLTPETLAPQKTMIRASMGLVTASTEIAI
jgi:hypothetical protein